MTATNLTWERDEETGEQIAEDSDGRGAFLITRHHGRFDLYVIRKNVVDSTPCFRGSLAQCKALASDMNR
jgi:hypothetical protein